jgi:hypothetical protein
MSIITPDLIDAALDRITRDDHVTMVELGRLLSAHGVETHGNYALCAGADPNVIFWAGMSEPFLALVKALWPLTDHPPSSYLAYLIDGGLLSIPIAKRPPKAGYTSPHWVPVCFRPKASGRHLKGAKL